MRGRESKEDFCGRVNGEGIVDRGLVEREDIIQAKAESASKQQFKDNETAEDIRKRAIERLKETKKRNSKNVVSRDAQNHWSTVREKTAADCEIRQQELRAKQQEHKSQQQMMKAIILQQQQLNKDFLNVVEKLLNN